MQNLSNDELLTLQKEVAKECQKRNLEVENLKYELDYKFMLSMTKKIDCSELKYRINDCGGPTTFYSGLDSMPVVDLPTFIESITTPECWCGKCKT